MSHRREYPFCSVSYWEQTNTMSRASEEESEYWTHCRVEPIGSISGYGTQEILRKNVHQRDSLISLLQTAYEHGRNDAKAEIRKVIGCKGD